MTPSKGSLLTVLSYQTLRNLCAGDTPLIVNTVEASFRSASYDLRLGHEYFMSSSSGKKILKPLTVFSLEGGKILEVPANHLVLIVVAERLNVPDHLVGHLSLKLDLLRLGLMMASQSQIDAGYQGPIFGLLYNLSQRSVTLRPEQPVFRLEFAELDAPSDKPYDGGWEDATLIDFVPNRLSSSLAYLQDRIQKQQRLNWGGVAVLVGLTLAVVGIIFPVLERARIAEREAALVTVEVREIRDQREAFLNEITDLGQEVTELQRRLLLLETSP